MHKDTARERSPAADGGVVSGEGGVVEGRTTDESAPLSVEQARAFDGRIAILSGVGLARERILGQLLSAGVPMAFLRERFAEFPAEVFVRPAARALPNARRAPVASPQAGRALAPIDPPITTAIHTPTRSAASPLRALVPQAALPARAAATLERALFSEGISFHYVPLIQCSFPHADPGVARSFTRKNGWLELTLGTTKPDVGLPYGVPSRLLTIYCASEAVRTKSPEIYLGQSVHEFLRRLDVPITRGARGSLSVYANQVLRLVHSTLSIDENIRDASGRSGLHIRQALFVEEARLWWDERDGVGQGSSLVLSSVLFNSILERSAPLSTKAIRQLRKSPMDLDVYAWLAHRLFHLSKPSSITWQQLSDQFGHGYRLLRKFRRHFAESVRRVQVVYPEARLKVADVGVILMPSKPHVPRDALGRRR